MNALLFDPYLDTLGGGERYTLTVAQILSDLGWQVTLAWHDLKSLDAARQRFNLPLKNVEISPEFYNLFFTKADLFTRRRALKNLDLVFFVSDGSVPILFGKNKILHYQVPFTRINRVPLLNSLKLLSIDQVVVNSKFTKKVIDKTLGSNRSQVLYPPVAIDSFKPGKKAKTILNVGRFASPSHSKRQDVLIDAFIKLRQQTESDWQLVLAGATFGEQTILDDLKDQAKGYPIEFVINPKFQDLVSLYSEATFYWHAAGFEVDEVINPESVEHFGITTVEAMSAGCIPLVANKGGQKEIVTKKEGYLWESVDELIKQTLHLIKKPRKQARLSASSQQKAEEFSVACFSKDFIKLLK